MTIRSAAAKFLLRLLALLLIAATLMSREHIPHLPHEPQDVQIICEEHA